MGQKKISQFCQLLIRRKRAKLQWAEGGAQRHFLRVIEPKKTGARSALAWPAINHSILSG
jgi:hypothetical protein